MESLQSYLGQELRWTQPAFADALYELRAPEMSELLATLRSDVTSAEGTTHDGVFYFQYGTSMENIEVRTHKEANPIAMLQRHTNKTGTLTFTNGARFEFKVTNFWESEWQWESTEGAVLMHFRSQQTWKTLVKPEAILLIDSVAADFAETPLLVLLG